MYLFRRYREYSDGKVGWKCTNTMCRCKIDTLNDELINYVNEHQHQNDADVIWKKKLREKMFNKVCSNPFIGAGEAFNAIIREFL
jgi:hypothetical protein